MLNGLFAPAGAVVNGVVGDYVFGQGSANFWVNSPEAVGASVLTRLRLNQGEWFLDKTIGLPLFQQVLGYNTESTRDLVIKQQILATPGVTSLAAYASEFDAETREFTLTDCQIYTQYGPAPVQLAPVVI